MPSTSDRTFALLVGLCAAAYQLSIVHHFAINVPFWDEWDDFVGFVSTDRFGALRWADWVAPHMEHRIVVPRIAFLAVGRLFGEANLLALLALSAVLMGAIVAVWTYTLRRLQAPLWLIGASLVVLLSFSQYENMLWAFQTPFYVIMLSMIAAISGLALATRVSWRLTIGLSVAGILASLSLVSGLVVWPILGVLLAFRLWLDGVAFPRLPRERVAWAQIAVFCLVGLATCGAYLTNYNPLHPPLAGGTWTMMLKWAGFAFGFPVLDPTKRWEAAWLPLLLAVETIPIVAALVLYVRRRDRPRLILSGGILLLVLLHVASMAYGRSSAVWVASRYGTVLLWASAVSLMASADLIRATWDRRRGVACLLAVGVVILVAGHAWKYSKYLDEMRDFRRVRVEFRTNVMTYLASHDPNRELADFVPFPKDRLKRFLDTRTFVRVLPSDLRPNAYPGLASRGLSAFVRLADIWLVLSCVITGVWIVRTRSASAVRQ